MLPPQLTAERLLAFDFSLRLNMTVHPRRVAVALGSKMQRWDDLNNGRALQCLASSGLWFLRAGLACLRCAGV